MMFKTKGGGGQRLFEQCSKKLQIWWRLAPLRGALKANFWKNLGICPDGPFLIQIETFGK